MGKTAACALVIWLAIGVAHIHPHYLAYFNEAAGGPARGYRVLVDASLDWGQDLKGLATEIKRRGDPPLSLSYFGVSDPAYYGLRYVPVDFTTPLERHEGVLDKGAAATLLAVSATNLQGVYYDDKTAFAWLKSRTPVYSAGYSIFLHDLTDDREGRDRISLQARGLISDRQTQP